MPSVVVGTVSATNSNSTMPGFSGIADAEATGVGFRAGLPEAGSSHNPELTNEPLDPAASSVGSDLTAGSYVDHFQIEKEPSSKTKR